MLVMLYMAKDHENRRRTYGQHERSEMPDRKLPHARTQHNQGANEADEYRKPGRPCHLLVQKHDRHQRNHDRHEEDQ